MDAGERYFGENSFDGLLIPLLLSSSLSIWLIEAIFLEPMESSVDLGTGVGGFIEIPWSLVSGEFPISHIVVRSEQDDLPLSVGHDYRARLDDGRMYSDILRQSDCLDQLSKIPWVVSTFVVIEGERFSMMLLEHHDVIAKFYGPSRWKELSKEASNKILLCGDGSFWKTFNPIASLIAKGKLT
ncbi:hypothetical protein Tco_1371526 [Tanacetum coccineum]